MREWIADNSVNVLNVAGPRDSGDPRIYDVTVRVLEMALVPAHFVPAVQAD